MKSGIYKIQNKINNKRYIGSAVKIIHRINAHKSKLKLNYHPSKHLQASYNKYGSEAFIFEVIEYCNSDKLIEREQFYLDQFDLKNLYNKRKEAVSNFGWRGWKQNNEWIEKRVSRLRGRKITDPEILKNMSDCQKGKKLSNDHKESVSISLKGHSVSQETRNKISKAHSEPNKWPHGYKCNCRDCLDKKNNIRRQSRINTSPRFAHLKEVRIIQL